MEILKKAGVKAAPADIVFPPDSKMGDLSVALFAAAKEKSVAPGKLAQEVVKKIKPQGLVEKVEAAGAYVNFWLRREELSKVVLDKLEQYSSSGAKRSREAPLRGQRILLEMVSPNNNKPLHLGHLRNAFLGESVSRLLESQGAKVIRACLFNDRGLAIAKAMLAYQKWGGGTSPEVAQMNPVRSSRASGPGGTRAFGAGATSNGMKGDQFVVQWYVRFEQENQRPETRNKKQIDLVKQAEELVQKWEAGDKDTLALWKKMSNWANDGIMFSLKRLGMKFDTIYYESKLWKQGKKMVAEGLKKGVFKKAETGAVMVEFNNLPPKILLRSDGTAIYATTDLALTPEKFKKYKLDRAIWCVGQEQNLYLKQLFAILKMLGYKWADKCEHLTYGLVHLPEGRMKTREGTVVEADPLLDHLVELVEKEIKERHTHLTEREAEDRAEILAQAAVRYYLLKVGPKQAVHFDPKASISFTGDTGPYLLYTYARIASILRKSKEQGTSSKKNNAALRVTGYTLHDAEWHLTLLLARFPEEVTTAAIDRDPSILAKYLFELTQLFSNFYEKSPVLKAKEPTRSFRLALISTFQKTLKEGLRFLTIQTVEEM